MFQASLGTIAFFAFKKGYGWLKGPKEPATKEPAKEPAEPAIKEPADPPTKVIISTI